jgi:hypothetical protein
VATHVKPSCGADRRFRALSRWKTSNNVFKVHSLETRREFDWATCLSLAGCSFESYNDVVDSAHLIQETPNGTEISYLDRVFLEQKYEAVLKVVICRATNIEALNWIPGTATDPYVSLSIDGSCYRSNTKWTTLNPEWNETAYFFVENLATSRLRLSLSDDGIAIGDRLIGSNFVSLKDLQEGHPTEIEVPIGSKGTKVQLVIACTTLSNNKRVEDLVLADVKDLVGACPENLMESMWRRKMRAALNPEKRSRVDFDPVCFVENKETDTQAWIFCSRPNKILVIAFRGTEQTQLKDLMTDAMLLPTRVEYDESRLIKSNEPLTDLGVWVHSGFFKSYMSIQSEILSIVKTITGQSNEWSVFCTGHSLGGALSTICAYDIACANREAKFLKSLQVYNYGSPMVGNVGFKEEFNALIPETWRVVNENDGVSRVPRMIGYCHVGNRVTLFPDGAVEFLSADDNDATEDVTWDEVVKQFGYSKVKEFAAEVKDLKSIVDLIGDFTGTDEEIDVEDIVEQEVESLSALLSGRAITEHMEDEYLKNLEKRYDIL